MPNWKSQDAKAGLMFLAISLFFGLNTWINLGIGSLEEMGAGFFPLSLSVILLALGAGLLISAPRQAHTPVPVNWRAVLLISSAPVAFALSVRSLGLLPALLISVALAVMASRRVRPLHALAVVAGVTVFCVVVFKFGVRVPYPLIKLSL